MSDSDIIYQNPSPGKYFLTGKTLGYLRGAASWVVFLGILMFILCGFFALVGIFSLIMGIGGYVLEGFDFGFDEDIPDLFVSAVYLISAVFVFIPARFLYRFGRGLRDFFISRADEDLEKAFKNNKSFWKFHGILAIVSLALLPVALVGFFISLLLSVL